MNTLHTKKNLTVGILAHVDAGKTTLAEAILYTCGKIRNLGRVDHKDAFLDNFALERERGITIFSKQAQITLGDMNITLLDTPGHVDFSAEMERTLQVLDYAILVISGADGVQGHVLTLWRLLARYDIPVFLFINKMDQEGTDKERLLEELQTRLDEHCILCGHQAEEAPGARELFLDAAAMCSESLMEEYLETGELSEESLAEAIADRQIFPCYFGSALKLVGVEEMLQGLQRKVLLPEYPSEFGARVFKIARDQNGKRLTYLKVTGGCLRVKMLLSNASSAESVSQIWEEKADGLRIYEGAGYLSVEEVSAGGVCAVTGLTRTFAGQGLGYEEENALPVLEPVLTYQLLLPEESDVISVLGQLRQLEEEEPLLHILWKEEVQEIHVQVMGEVQLEILRSLLQERFGLEADFGTGSIVYKETLAEPVVGIGHFEPLRHYAEVQLLLEPGERGSGLQFASVCSEDVLDKNWQRLVMTHLEEKKHMGVLTGSEITDLKIVLLAGRAHQKHTEGGDFRQATYRAVRQGLRRGKNVLLEPVFSFVLEVPTEMLGRAMSDVQRMYGSFEVPETMGETSILRGKAPVATMRDYQIAMNAYTKGKGSLFCTLEGYGPCHNAEEVITAANYDPDQDVANPSSSVFCAHGAGFIVPWEEVPDYMHVESVLCDRDATRSQREKTEDMRVQKVGPVDDFIDEEQIEEIINRTSHANEKGSKRPYKKQKPQLYTSYKGQKRPVSKEKYMIVDGYNIVHAWDELKELLPDNLDGARTRLMDILCDYQAMVKCELILVFDAYRVKGNIGEMFDYHNIHIVYTKEAETADAYIEKLTHKIAKDYPVTVATSDGLIQLITRGQNCVVMSARELKEEIARVKDSLQDYLQE